MTTKPQCPVEKSNVNDCACRCDLKTGHTGDHHCYCGQTWKRRIIIDGVRRKKA